MSLEYKQVLKREEFGSLGSFGLEILVSTDHDLTRDEDMAIMRAYDVIREAVGIVSAALNPQETEARNKEQQEFVDMFGSRCLWHAIPNQYCSRWCEGEVMASKLMPSEWAIQEARRFTEKWKLIRCTLPIARLLDSVRDECRREGLEEAAKIARESLYAYQVRDRIEARLAQEPRA